MKPMSLLGPWHLSRQQARQSLTPASWRSWACVFECVVAIPFCMDVLLEWCAQLAGGVLDGVGCGAPGLASPTPPAQKVKDASSLMLGAGTSGLGATNAGWNRHKCQYVNS